MRERVYKNSPTNMNGIVRLLNPLLRVDDMFFSAGVKSDHEETSFLLEIARGPRSKERRIDLDFGTFCLI